MAARAPANQGRPGRSGAAHLLQLRQALAELQHPDLAAQAHFAIEALLRGADAPLLDCFFAEALRAGGCPPSARRLRYRCAASALRSHAVPDWGPVLLHLRDHIVERVGAEDHAGAAAELQALARQLTAALVDAYSCGRYAALGFAAKAAVPQEWLSRLLVAPLLQAACRGRGHPRCATACLTLHGVLEECGRWAKSASVLHAAVDCLRQMLKLAGSGALVLGCGEALLPVQSCVALLGPRLKEAALLGLLQMCTAAMQRGEWQVRKAAADTLAATAAALLAEQEPAAPAAAGTRGGRGGERQAQAQGAAALESVAPAMLAALERYVRYDRVPQVRTAAASALRQLRKVPRLQQEQRPPLGQLQGDSGGSKTAASPPGSARAAAAQAASPLPGAVRAATGLRAAISERRQQLKASGEWRRAPEEASEHQDPAAAEASKPWVRRSGGSSTGSADGGEWEAGGARIRAWAGGGSDSPNASLPLAASPPAAPQLRARAAAEQAEVVLPRPPSADVFRTADEALYCLRQTDRTGEARQRQPPGNTTRPLAAAATGAEGLPPPGAAAPLPPAERQVWRQNPLAEAPAGGGGQACEAAAPPPHSVHYVEHPQFLLRLQAGPPLAEVRLAGGGGVPSLTSVRLWAAAAAADVGVEFALGGVQHAYWLQGGLLHSTHKKSVAPEAEVAVEQPAEPGQASPAEEPAAQHCQQTPLSEPHGGRPAAAAETAAFELPAESPLASLATAALPSFSPEKQPAPRASPAATAQQNGSTEQAACPAATPQQLGATGPAPGAAEGGPPQCVSPGRGVAEAPLPTVPAGARSSSPGGQQHPAAARWAAGLRPARQQLQAGLPGWDGSRSPSPQPRLSRYSSRPVSLQLSPAARTAQQGSQPASPLRAARHASQPASPDRHLQPRHEALPSPAAAPQLPPAASPLPVPSARPPRSPQRLPAGAASSPAPSAPPSAPFAASADAPGPPPLPAWPGGQRSPGPLTVMVTRAVSKLRQLEELEQELALPPEPLFTDPAGGGTQDGGGASALHRLRQARQLGRPDPRRSLDTALTAIAEGTAGSGSDSDGGSSDCEGWRSVAAAAGSAKRQPAGSLRSSVAAPASVKRRRRSRGREAGEAGALGRLQEQLRLSVAEVQRQVESRRRPDAPDSPEAEPPAGSVVASWQQRPAAWRYGRRQEAQEEPNGRVQAWERAWERAEGSPASSGSCSGGYDVSGAAAAAGPEPEGSEEEEAVQPAHRPPSQPLLAVSNPLFGAPRPGSAATQAMPGMLPRKAPLARRLAPAPRPEGRPGGGGAGGEEERGQRARRASRQSGGAASPQDSGGGAALQSLGSLGSGFGALQRESEAEVQQFLRGSLAVPRRQDQAAVPPPQRPLPASPPKRRQRAARPAPAGQAAAAAGAGALGPLFPASLDLSAILGSRPASPDVFPPSPDFTRASNGGDGGGGASEGAPWLSAHSVWQAASPEASPVRAAVGGAVRGAAVQQRGAEPSPARFAGSGDAWAAAAAREEQGSFASPPSPASRGEALSDEPQVAADTAWVSLQEAGRKLGRPQEQLGGSPSLAPLRAGQRAPLRPGSPLSEGGGRPAEGRQALVLGQQERGLDGGSRDAASLPPRPPSPLLPGLGVSRRQARQLQAAVGRLAGIPSAEDAAALQAALTATLEQETAHVQEHYERAAALQLGRLRRAQGPRPAQLAAAAAALEEQAAAAVRRDLAVFVGEALPRLAEMLGSPGKQARCLAAAAEGEGASRARTGNL